ncbi:MAG: CotH kinase family protein [Bacteroidetes bacterium]|nr:CotH kinase family protein [Bacteroidota bacterium]
MCWKSGKEKATSVKNSLYDKQQVRRAASILLLILLIFSQRICSQVSGAFYSTDSVREIRLYFHEANWSHLLDSMIQAGDGEGRLIGDVSIEGHLFKDAGIRYKGYSSWNVNTRKNPFNVDLDWVHPNQNYQGYRKLKLSNVIHDPSFVREVLSYEIARKYLPASLANFANVYVNDSLVGLYTNVEAVDKDFIYRQYKSKNGAFFKGSPEQLVFPFGENANLADTHGTDSAGYYPFYKMESDVGWEKFYKFIHILNKVPDTLEEILNTDRALWMHAFNYTLVNLDSYIGYSQNYYVYQDDNGRFNPILWDMNMSFGSFRNSDGSDHFQGLTIDETKKLDPLQHLTFSITPRPLMTKLFLNDTLKKMYLAHIRTILNENILTHTYLDRGQVMQDKISQYVVRDTNKFYSDSDFTNNLNITVGGTAGMIQYPGIRDLMESRAVYLNTYTGISSPPQLSEIGHTPAHPEWNGEVSVSVRVAGASEVMLGFRFNSKGVFMKTNMYDDGNHQDGQANDGIYGASVPCRGYIMQYYIYAQNDSTGVFSPERAEYEYYTIYPRIYPGDLVINEIKTSGPDTYAGTYISGGNWIELFNNTTEDIPLQGYTLSDDASSLFLWPFPDTLVGAKSYLMVHASGQSVENELCAGFSLDENEGNLFLSDNSARILDSLYYGQQFSTQSLGRFPNGTGPFVYMTPSYSAYNYYATTERMKSLVFPNPAHHEVYLEVESHNQSVFIELFNACGQQVYKESTSFPGESSQVHGKIIDLSAFSSGLYYFYIRTANQVSTQKLVIE